MVVDARISIRTILRTIQGNASGSSENFSDLRWWKPRSFDDFRKGPRYGWRLDYVYYQMRPQVQTPLFWLVEGGLGRFRGQISGRLTQTLILSEKARNVKQNRRISRNSHPQVDVWTFRQAVTHCDKFSAT